MKTIKILIAEDHLDNFLLLKAQLKNLPYIITHSKDGLDALKKIEEESFDIYLIDIQMPNIDGYEFIKRVRENNDKTPAIAQTANAFSSDYDKCINSGYDEYISKPVNKEDLRKKIEDLINRLM